MILPSNVEISWEDVNAYSVRDGHGIGYIEGDGWYRYNSDDNMMRYHGFFIKKNTKFYAYFLKCKNKIEAKVSIAEREKYKQYAHKILLASQSDLAVPAAKQWCLEQIMSY